MFNCNLLNEKIDDPKAFIIALDFDGTVVTHEYPRVGKDIGAVDILKKYAERGCKYILNTMRGNLSGDLGEAIKWFKENDIELIGINCNPTQTAWTNSPKVYANCYIDDMALGCPLIYRPWISYRPFIDWEIVDIMIEERLRTFNQQKY